MKRATRLMRKRTELTFQVVIESCMVLARRETTARRD
jgi:hypothetical protein